MLNKSNQCPLSTDLLLSIMEYLDAKDLCRSAQVSWSWYYITRTLDNTTWKRLFIRDVKGILNFRSVLVYFENLTEIKNQLINEDYLMNTFSYHSDEKTWKDIYRNHFIWKRMWKLRSEEVLAKSCGCVTRPLMSASEIHVGFSGCQYMSIKDAMANIYPYCTVIIHPGNYDEQIKISILVPIQMIGPGSNGAITSYFDCDASAVRLCNLFIKPPWFSELLLKVRGGLVQLESCTLSNGEINVASPGVIAMRYCCVDNAKITLIKSYCSTIEHCEFNNNTDFNDFIHIEGLPKYERLTACLFLKNQIKKWLPITPIKKNFIPFDTGNVNRLTKRSKSHGSINILTSKSLNNSSKFFSKFSRKHSKNFNSDISKIQKIHTQVNLSLLKEQRTMHLFLHSEENMRHEKSFVKHLWRQNSFDDLLFYGYKNSFKNLKSKSVDRKFYSKFIKKCCRKPEIRQIMNTINGPMILNCNFANSKLVINCTLEAQVIVINCEMSSCTDIIRLSRFSKAFIYHNRLHHSSGCAICLKHNSEAAIIGNEIYGMGEGAVEVRKNTFPYILANKIHSNERCGISFISSNGQVEFNDICFNKVGMNVLHTSNPIIRSNTIRSNKSHGIMINERSISVIDDNLIFQNSDSNILIRKCSAPVITSNLIYKSTNDGIEFRDNSKGTIANNIIMENSKNGISLFYADYPYIYGNQICRNNLHGIYIGRINLDGDTMSVDQENEVEDDLLTSYCDTIYDSEFCDYDHSNNNTDFQDEDLEQYKINSTDRWIRRKNNLIHIEFNSIYFNIGCGICNDTNTALEILNNAIHLNFQNGISLNVPGFFGSVYESPKVLFEISNKSVAKINQLPNMINTFIFDDKSSESILIVKNKNVVPFSGDNHSQWKTRQRTLGQILKNSITDNGSNGITINTTNFSAARFVIVGNGIYDNQENGISTQTQCEIIGNDILGNNKAAIEAKPHAWIYLTMNRLHSAQTSAINIYEPPITLISKNNIVYSDTLQSDVISVAMSNNRASLKQDKFSFDCFNAFRSANLIEYYPTNQSEAPYVNDLKLSVSNVMLPAISANGSHNYPLRPIIVKDTHYNRVSLALSEALNAFNRSSRSMVCQFI